MKKLLCISLATLTLFSSVPAFAAESMKVTTNDSNVYFNGEKVEPSTDYPLISHNGVVYLPLTFDNMQKLGIESEWSEDIGLNLSTDGTMYKPDMNFKDLETVYGTDYETLADLMGYENQEVGYSGSLEYGVDGYMHLNGQEITFGESSEAFKKYFKITENKITDIEFGTFAIRHSGASEMMMNLVTEFGPVGQIIVNGQPSQAGKSIEEIQALILAEDYDMVEFVWEKEDGQITAKFSGYNITENGTFTVTYSK